MFSGDFLVSFSRTISGDKLASDTSFLDMSWYPLPGHFLGIDWKIILFSGDFLVSFPRQFLGIDWRVILCFWIFPGILYQGIFWGSTGE